MKFGKEFGGQMIQEWQTAYMDYHGLKNLLKDVMKKNARKIASNPDQYRSKTLTRKRSLYRAFSGLQSCVSRKYSPRPEDEVILVNEVHPSEEDDEESGGVYQTEFLMTNDEDGEKGEEVEVRFFRKMDAEFNKVVKFYKDKMSGIRAKADELTKQMNALIALRVKVDYPLLEVLDNAAATPNGAGRGTVPLEAIEEVDSSREEDSTHGGERPSHETESRSSSMKREFRPPPLQVLDQVKINVDPATPVSTLKMVFNASHPDLSYSKAELNSAQEKLKQAFVVFHRELRYLKSYSFLNVMAFSKIMKKYDKVTSTNASKSYMEMVENSVIGNTDEITGITNKVEATVVKHFSNGNHSEGMKLLRPEERREKHRVTFFLGVFFGSSIALVIGILISIQAKRLLDDEKGKTAERDKYMKTIFPLYSLFGYICLHMVCYAGNVFVWRYFRVNYPFIFGFNERNRSLGFRQVLLVASGLAVITLAAVLSNLDLEMNSGTEKYSSLTESVPLAVFLGVLIVLFSPFDFMYRSTRLFFLTRVWHCLCAPLYKVSLPDFFFADQLTSQVQAIRCLQFYVVYYGWGYFRHRDNSFENNSTYKLLYIVVAIIPYWSRFLQCARRLVEEKDIAQLYNGLKYFSTIFALVIRTLYSQNRFHDNLRVLTIASGIFTTVYNTYWDIVKDWGFMQKNSRNPWLRDKLLIQNKLVYFGAMVVNVLLRLVWMQMVYDFQVPFLHKAGMTAVVACLEIIRRGIWNFFRLENEHLNNVGKYRAFNAVPLPFFYEEDKDE